MSWLRVDDGFAQHPKVAALTDREFRHWLRLLLWCARYKTGGDVPDYALRELGVPPAVTAAFLELGLLDQEEDGLTVHDWSQFNPKDATGAERQKRFRNRKRNGPSNAKRNAASNGPSRAQARARKPVPVPSKEAKAPLRRPNPIWDAMSEELGEPVTASERTLRGKNVAELREAGATAEQVHERSVRFHRGWPEMTLTGPALVKHWTTLATLEPSRNGQVEQSAEEKREQAARDLRRRMAEAGVE